jgi:hypothetical protein
MLRHTSSTFVPGATFHSTIVNHTQPHFPKPQFPLYFRQQSLLHQLTSYQLNSISHIASFSEMMESTYAPSYSTLEFTLPLRAFQVESGMTHHTQCPYSKLVLPGDGYNLSRVPVNWNLSHSVPFVQRPRPLHVSVTGVALSHDFVERNPYVTVTILAPPRSNMGSSLRSHVAPVVFGISHVAPKGTVLPQELTNRDDAHVTLSGFLRLR